MKKYLFIPLLFTANTFSETHTFDMALTGAFYKDYCEIKTIRYRRDIDTSSEDFEPDADHTMGFYYFYLTCSAKEYTLTAYNNYAEAQDIEKNQHTYSRINISGLDGMGSNEISIINPSTTNPASVTTTITDKKNQKISNNFFMKPIDGNWNNVIEKFSASATITIIIEPVD